MEVNEAENQILRILKEINSMYNSWHISNNKIFPLEGENARNAPEKFVRENLTSYINIILENGLEDGKNYKRVLKYLTEIVRNENGSFNIYEIPFISGMLENLKELDYFNSYTPDEGWHEGTIEDFINEVENNSRR